MLVEKKRIEQLKEWLRKELKFAEDRWKFHHDRTQGDIKLGWAREEAYFPTKRMVKMTYWSGEISAITKAIKILEKGGLESFREWIEEKIRFAEERGRAYYEEACKDLKWCGFLFVHIPTEKFVMATYYSGVVRALKRILGKLEEIEKGKDSSEEDSELEFELENFKLVFDEDDDAGR